MDFVIQSVQDDYELHVKLLHCPSWPDRNDSKKLYNFILKVHERGSEYRNGPLIIVDR